MSYRRYILAKKERAVYRCERTVLLEWASEFWPELAALMAYKHQKRLGDKSWIKIAIGAIRGGNTKLLTHALINIDRRPRTLGDLAVEHGDLRVMRTLKRCGFSNFDPLAVSKTDNIRAIFFLKHFDHLSKENIIEASILGNHRLLSLFRKWWPDVPPGLLNRAAHEAYVFEHEECLRFLQDWISESLNHKEWWIKNNIHGAGEKVMIKIPSHLM